MWSALNGMSVPAALLAVCVGMFYTSSVATDAEAIEAAAREPFPRKPETRGYRFPDPDDYPLKFLPWIESREDLIAHFTRGEDPEVVRRYSEGPEGELIEYLGEAFIRVTARYPMGLPTSPPLVPPTSAGEHGIVAGATRPPGGAPQPRLLCRLDRRVQSAH
jgi:hypothetical protein